ncbi:hypothetical protein ACLOJK_012840 [Asimina triloba]
MPVSCTRAVEYRVGTGVSNIASARLFSLPRTFLTANSEATIARRPSNGKELDADRWLCERREIARRTSKARIAYRGRESAHLNWTDTKSVLGALIIRPGPPARYLNR